MDRSVNTAMIQIRDLVKLYGPTKALSGVSFEVPRGQVVGFLGPNGAGKTTTMRILTGYLQPTSGNAKVAGIDVAEDSLSARKKIGYLPENNPLYEEMMVHEYLDFVAHVRDIPHEKRKGMISIAAERCGLGPVISKDIGSLSKGFKQRVGLAQAILHDPDLLVLDEPTSGLDPNQIVEIRSLIKELGQEKTVLMSTHILSEVQTTCSRVIIINEGVLVADDSPEGLTNKDSGSISLEVAAQNDAPFDVKALCQNFRSIKGVTKVTGDMLASGHSAVLRVSFDHDDPRRALFEKVVHEKLVLLEMRKKEVSLEDTFRKLTMEA